jgi:hypothetical protein
MTYSHNKFGMYVTGGRGYYSSVATGVNHHQHNIFSDIWFFDFSSDVWKPLEQTGYRLPYGRYGAMGGMYPSYEVADARLNNLYMAFGQSQYFMYGNVFKYGFTDARSSSGIWYEGACSTSSVITPTLSRHLSCLFLFSMMKDFHDYAGPFGADYAHARYGHSATMIAPDVLLIFGGCLRSVV